MTDAVRDHEAHYKIETHEKVCAERYGNLWAAVQRIENALAAHHAANDKRMTAFSNRQWSLVVGCGAAAFIGLAVIAMHILTKVKL